MSLLLRSIRLSSARAHQRLATIRYYSDQSSPSQQQQQQPHYQAPAPPQELPNPHREIYKRGGAGRAIAFNFLIAMATFQVLYWSWLKLESVEVKREKSEEVDRLEQELKALQPDGKAR